MHRPTLARLARVVTAMLVLAACRERNAPPHPATSPPSQTPVAESAAALDAASPGAPDSGAAGPAAWNVLLLTIDSLRADMPWTGYPRPIAPRLTALESRAVSFTRAYAISSYTSMSLGGMLAGTWPSELKRDGFFFGTYAKENLFFPELLQTAKVTTLSAHAHGYFKNAGFEQGFDKWLIVPNLKWNNTTDENVTSPAHEQLAESLLDGLPTDARFFAWFHFLDPHDQYVSHDKDGIAPFGKTLRDRYDAEVLFTDRHIGKLLDYVEGKPWSSHTVIIVSADHGEAFGEKKQFAHGFELWEHLVRVPFFFVVPHIAPRRIDTPVSAIDLAPTVLDLFGITPPTGMRGQSLLPVLRGASPEGRSVVTDLPATSDNDARRAIYQGRHKLIAFGSPPRFQLFDLENDPQENAPITRGELFIDMVGRYKEWAKTIQDVPPTRCREGCLNGGYRKP